MDAVLEFKVKVDSNPSIQFFSALLNIMYLQLQKTIDMLRERLTARQKEGNELRAKYNIGEEPR